MAVIREPKEKDLMHFTRYAIEHFHIVREHENGPLSDRLRERKYWAADQLFGNDDGQKLLIAEKSGEMIGYIFGTIENPGSESEYGCVREIFVDEFYRREGIGTELCEALMKWMHERGVTGVQLDMLASYPKAELFFESIGFSPMKKLYRWSPKSV
ncbi:GNAT family N-acetyltransferase [Halobacillus fulvus]|nr:GNAT family N-acetyltransferase [Halobacillus fulvus]